MASANSLTRAQEAHAMGWTRSSRMYSDGGQ